MTGRRKKERKGGRNSRQKDTDIDGWKITVNTVKEEKRELSEGKLSWKGERNKCENEMDGNFVRLKKNGDKVHVRKRKKNTEETDREKEERRKKEDKEGRK